MKRSQPHAQGPDEAASTPAPAGEPRIYGPFPAVVKGVDALGERFKARGVLDALTASDFRLRLPRPVKVGERLFVAARIHKAAVLLRGTVSRAAPGGEGGCRLEVAISHNRFLAPAFEGFFAAEAAGGPGPAGAA